MNLRSFSPLQIALGASFAVHAALLTVRFVDPEGFNRVFEDTPLDLSEADGRWILTGEGGVLISFQGSHCTSRIALMRSGSIRRRSLRLTGTMGVRQGTRSQG